MKSDSIKHSVGHIDMLMMIKSAQNLVHLENRANLKILLSNRHAE